MISSNMYMHIPMQGQFHEHTHVTQYATAQHVLGMFGLIKWAAVRCQGSHKTTNSPCFGFPLHWEKCSCSFSAITI